MSCTAPNIIEKSYQQRIMSSNEKQLGSHAEWEKRRGTYDPVAQPRNDAAHDNADGEEKQGTGCWAMLTEAVSAFIARHTLLRWLILVITVTIQYANFATDVRYAQILREAGLVGLSNVVIGILLLPPLALSAMDLYEYYTTPAEVRVKDVTANDMDGFDGAIYDKFTTERNRQRDALIGWKGVLLNLTNTRMMYMLLIPEIGHWRLFECCFGSAGKDAWSVTARKAIKQAGTNVKLFGAIFASMPQLYVQSVILFDGLLDASKEPITIYSSLALSFISIAAAVAGKVLQIIDPDKISILQLVAVYTYFSTDAVLRTITAVLLFAMDTTGVALVLAMAVLVVVDFAVQAWQARLRRSRDVYDLRLDRVVTFADVAYGQSMIRMEGEWDFWHNVKDLRDLIPRAFPRVVSPAQLAPAWAAPGEVWSADTRAPIDTKDQDAAASQAEKLIRSGEVTVNGTAVDPSYKVKAGDALALRQQRGVTLAGAVLSVFSALPLSGRVDERDRLATVSTIFAAAVSILALAAGIEVGGAIDPNILASICLGALVLKLVLHLVVVRRLDKGKGATNTNSVFDVFKLAVDKHAHMSTWRAKDWVNCFAKTEIVTVASDCSLALVVAGLKVAIESENYTIRKMDFSLCHVDDATAVALADVLQMQGCALESVKLNKHSLHGNDTTGNDGWQALLVGGVAEIVLEPTFGTDWTLARFELTDVSCPAIAAAILKSNRIQKLDLAGNAMSHKGLALVMDAIVKCKTIQQVIVSDQIGSLPTDHGYCPCDVCVYRGEKAHYDKCGRYTNDYSMWSEELKNRVGNGGLEVVYKSRRRNELRWGSGPMGRFAHNFSGESCEGLLGGLGGPCAWGGNCNHETLSGPQPQATRSEGGVAAISIGHDGQGSGEQLVLHGRIPPTEFWKLNDTVKHPAHNHHRCDPTGVFSLETLGPLADAVAVEPGSPSLAVCSATTPGADRARVQFGLVAPGSKYMLMDDEIIDTVERHLPPTDHVWNEFTRRNLFSKNRLSPEKKIPRVKYKKLSDVDNYKPHRVTKRYCRAGATEDYLLAFPLGLWSRETWAPHLSHDTRVFSTSQQNETPLLNSATSHGRLLKKGYGQYPTLECSNNRPILLGANNASRALPRDARSLATESTSGFPYAATEMSRARCQYSGFHRDEHTGILGFTLNSLHSDFFAVAGQWEREYTVMDDERSDYVFESHPNDYIDGFGGFPRDHSMKPITRKEPFPDGFGDADLGTAPKSSVGANDDTNAEFSTTGDTLEGFGLEIDL